MDLDCLKCKGKNPIKNCGKSFCPILAKQNSLFKIEPELNSTDFTSKAPSVFIGKEGYPFVNVGILSPINVNEDYSLYDSPKTWAKNDFIIPKIIDFRSSLINSREKIGILQTNNFLEKTKEVAMAISPPDIEVFLKNKPKFKLNFDPYLPPMGPNADVSKVSITSNPNIPTKVDYIVSDTDFKAVDAVADLYSHGFDENYLSKLLSVGNLGVRTDRKLVPTRWSITAVDDIVGKKLTEEIINYNESNYLAYFGSYLGNYFVVLFFPNAWSYELFEMYAPNASWNTTKEVQFTTDYESMTGRKTYAENCGGGYYASRIAVLEKLSNLKKRASVLTIRVITGEYSCPLGVWVVREATRKAMENKPIEFSSKDLMLNYLKILIKKKFGFEIENVLKSSILLKELNSQTKLSNFFK